MSFEFATAARILYGEGSVRHAVAAAGAMGERPLVVTGASPERGAAFLSGLKSLSFRVTGEPTIDAIRTGAEIARDARCDVVVAIGGGSAIDAGKAIAALLTNAGDPLDYLEVIGSGRALEHQSAACIAIPTTAGTGSEVTRNSVLASPIHGVKASLRSLHMLPRLAIVDPELTLGLPRAITASTGLDALTQLIEPYVSSRANAMADLYCVEGIRRVSRSLPRAWENGGDREARADISLAALFGGLALANAGLGAVHGFAAPVGGLFTAPHGAICAALLPHAMAVNLAALRSRDPQNRAIARYGEIAAILTGNPHASAEDGIRWVRELCERFEIPPLRSYGLDDSGIEGMIDLASKASSMKANPLVLTRDELREILVNAM